MSKCGNSLLTHTDTYSKIYDCDSVYKRRAKAPAERLNDMKQAVLWKCVTWPDICGSHEKQDKTK